jgi:hypothetical protein
MGMLVLMTDLDVITTPRLVRPELRISSWVCYVLHWGVCKEIHRHYEQRLVEVEDWKVHLVSLTTGHAKNLGPISVAGCDPR